MKKTKSVIIIFSFITIGVIALIFLLSTKTHMTPADTGNYIDRSSIVEPTINSGNYYLNGDTNGIYFEISDTVIKFQGDTQMKHDFFSLAYPDYQKRTDEECDLLENLILDDMRFWDKSYDFVIYTYVFPEENITYICDSEKSGSQSEYSPLGSLVYIDENTLQYKGYKFILID